MEQNILKKEMKNIHTKRFLYRYIHSYHKYVPYEEIITDINKKDISTKQAKKCDWVRMMCGNLHKMSQQ